MKTLHIDELLSFTKSEFSRFKDDRKANKSIKMEDIVQTGLSIFLLKDSSLLENSNRFTEASENMLRIFKINNRPSDRQFRTILDGLNSINIERVHHKIIAKLKKENLLKQYEYFSGWKILLVDGVHHFSSNKIHCKACQKTNHTDGTITYSHSMLCSVLASPNIKEVIPLWNEPIKNQDGATKNDCELNAAKRLIEKIQTRHAAEKIIFVEDALFANGPHIEKVQSKGNRFIICVKTGSGAGNVFEQVDRLKHPLCQRLRLKHSTSTYQSELFTLRRTRQEDRKSTQ